MAHGMNSHFLFKRIIGDSLCFCYYRLSQCLELVVGTIGPCSPRLPAPPSSTLDSSSLGVVVDHWGIALCRLAHGHVSIP
eukprot:1944402-Amphidinium_carterae.1